MMVIDVHAHIFPDAIAEKASVSIAKFYDIPVKQGGSVDALLRLGDEAGIDKFVVHSVATTPAHVQSVLKFITASVKAHPDRFIGFGSLHPDMENAEEAVRQMMDAGLRGVKLHPDIQRFKLDDYRCLKIYELCEGRLPILAHTGDYRYDFSNPNRLMPILRIYQNLTVIGAHMGGWSIQDEASRKLCDFPNLYVDCSSSFYNLEPALAREIMLRYGPDRVLFATDYPMWEPTEELEYFFSLGFSEEENRKMLSENAIRLFGLEL